MNETPLHDFPILVIMGKAGAGKDTLANMVQEYIYGTSQTQLERLRFSDPLKDMCAMIFGWNRKFMDDFGYKEALLDEPLSCELGVTLRTRREVLQYLGSVYRQMDLNVWVEAALRNAKMKLNVSVPDGYISTDCRFQNEQMAIVSNFESYCFVKIHRTGATPITANSEHESETGFDALYANMEFYVESGDMTNMRNVARMIVGYFFSHLGGYSEVSVDTKVGAVLDFQESEKGLE